MLNPKHSSIAIVLATTLVSVTPVSAAQDESPIARFLNDYGKDFYDQGNIAEAAHEFSKALLVDPGNATAQKYLAKMGFPGGLYPIKGSYEERVMRQIKKDDDLEHAAAEAENQSALMENVAADLARERNCFEDQLGQKEQELVAMREEVEGLRQTNVNANSKLTGQGKDLENVNAALKVAYKQIDTLSKDVAEKGNKELENETRIVALNEQLGNLRSDLESATLALAKGDVASSHKLDGLSRQIETLNKLLSQEEILMQERTKDLQKANERARQLERQLALAGPGTSGSDKRSTAEKSRELEQDVLIQNQNEQLSDLQEKISDLQERLTLTQHIVQEKETALQELAAKLTEAQSKCAN